MFFFSFTQEHKRTCHVTLQSNEKQDIPTELLCSKRVTNSALDMSIDHHTNMYVKISFLRFVMRLYRLKKSRRGLSSHFLSFFQARLLPGSILLLLLLLLLFLRPPSCR